MIEAAERAGLLRPGGTIIEPTSGNTGHGLAIAAALRGYRCVFVMADKQSAEKQALLRAYGAEVVLCPTNVPPESPESYYSVAARLARDIPGAFKPDQYWNQENPAAHEQTTGPEIWEDTDGAVDVFVGGVGTGGTITGVSRYLKKTKGKAILSVAVEPEVSPLITQTLAGQPLVPAPHKIQGIGANFVPKNLDLAMVDRVERVTNEESIATARRLAREEGILCGVSCGAAMAAALRLAFDPAFAGKTIVTVLPDSGERYLSGPLYEGLFAEVETMAASPVKP
jgi:cysteine synthase A